MMDATKRFFEEPELEVIKFNETDVIATSLLSWFNSLIDGKQFEGTVDAGTGDAPGRDDLPYFEDEL